MGFENGMLRHPVFCCGPSFRWHFQNRRGYTETTSGKGSGEGLLVSLADFGRYSMLVWAAMGVGLGILGLILLGDNHRNE